MRITRTVSIEIIPDTSRFDLALRRTLWAAMSAGHALRLMGLRMRGGRPYVECTMQEATILAPIARLAADLGFLTDGGESMAREALRDGRPAAATAYLIAGAA